MKKVLTLVILFFGLSRLKAAAQALDCSNFKNGTFLITDGTRRDTIVRNGNFQVETNNQDATRGTFNVKWVDDCTYTLTPEGDTFKGNPNIPKNAMLTIKIIKITANVCTQKITANYTDFVMTVDLERIK